MYVPLLKWYARTTSEHLKLVGRIPFLTFAETND